MYRSIGKILRGKATPFQLASACILATLLAFVPGFTAGPGLVLALVALLITLNANLAVAALVGIVMKLVALLTLPLAFEVGRVLIDGPLQPVFRGIVNAPVLAWFGFDRYATAGGFVLGLVLGIGTALVLLLVVRRFRAAMAGLETGSERYRKLTAKRSTRFGLWLLVGGRHGKTTYGDLLHARKGLPVRPLGVVAVVLSGLLLFLGVQFASEPLLTTLLQRNLERANGATVDVQSASLDLTEGRLIVAGLAVADASRLDRDVLRAERIECDVTATDLLRRRVALDRVTVERAESGVVRARPGRRVQDPPKRPDDEVETRPGEKTIEDYLEQAEQWKERLAEIRRWLERLSPSEPEDVEAIPGETWEERLRREARESGYASVVAKHLRADAPTLLVRELRAGGVRTEALGDDLVDIEGANLSTHPALVAAPTTFSMRSRSGRFATSVSLPHAAGAGGLDFAWSGLSVDDTVPALAGQRPVSGGTLDVRLNGAWDARGAGWIDLPLELTLHDTRVSLEGVGASDVERLDLPVGLRGPLDAPRISLDDQQLADALAKAGADRLSRELRQRLDEELGDEAKSAIERVLPGGTKDVEGTLKRLLGGDKDKGGG